MLDETLLDEIVIGREARDEPDAVQDQPSDPVPTAAPKPRSGRSRGRNTVFDDHGPQAATAAG